MNKINFKDQVLPHLVAIIVFLLVTVIYFKPVFFEHKSLSQHDIQQWEGGAKELIEFRETTGDEALWTNSMFSGMPGYLINVQWGNGILGKFQIAMALGLPHPVRIVYLSFLCFYILLISFGVRPYLAIAGALAFGLSSYNIIGISAGHNSRIAAVAFIPLVLAGIRTVFKGKYLLGFTVTALAVALELRVGHLQITYYLFLMIAAYGISELFFAVKNKELTLFFKRSGILVIAGILGLLTFIGSLLSTMEYSKYSIRGKSELTQVDNGENKDGLTKDYAFQYSNGIFEPMTLFISNILGGASQQKLALDSETAKFMLKQGASKPQVEQQIQAMPTYWGNQPITAPYYAGSIVIFLFVLGIITLPKKHTIWLVAMVTLGIMLSWGSSFSSFNYFMFDYFPGYNKFRSVTFAIVIPILAMNLLGFIALEKFLQGDWNSKSKKQLGIAFASAGGLAIVLWLFAGVFSYSGAVDTQLPEWLLAPLKADRQSLLKGSALAAFFMILFSGAGIYATLTSRINPSILYISLIFLMLIDLWSTDKKLLNDANFKRNPARAFFQKTDADNLILSDKTLDFRVFNLQNPWNEARTSYYHKSIGGYHGAKIRRYQDLISSGLTTEHQEVIATLRSGFTNFSEQGVLNMLNTRYLVMGASKDAVVINDNANGNAWFVSNIERVNSPDEELAKTQEVDTKSTAVLDQSKFKFNGSLAADGQVKLIKYAPNHLVYESSNDADGLAVFSEIYYKDDWKASIDGIEVPILRVNYVLRALKIPTGKHKIEFTFEPSIYNWANPIMMASSWLIILLIAGTLAFEFGFVGIRR
jgi:membrane protein YfhO